MLVKLYELKPDPALDKRMSDQGVVIRRVLPPELRALVSWIVPRFGEGWVSEVDGRRRAPAVAPASSRSRMERSPALPAMTRRRAASSARPASMRRMRGKGIGHALLLATLLDLRDQGYGYGIIGGAGPTDFYARIVGAIPIEGSIPGIYANMLPIASPDGVSESH